MQSFANNELCNLLPTIFLSNFSYLQIFQPSEMNNFSLEQFYLAKIFNLFFVPLNGKDKYFVLLLTSK